MTQELTYNKFGLTWRLLFRDPNNNEQIEFGYPMTVEFNIERNMSNSLNTGTFRIDNLTEATRKKMRQDHFQLVDYEKKVKNYKQVIFQAGYNNKLSTIFAGNVLQGYEYRNNTEIVMYLNCGDGAYAVANSYTNFTINRGQDKNDIIKNLINDLTGTGTLSIGAITNIDGKISKTSTYFGYTNEQIEKLSLDADMFIDLEAINLLKENDVIGEPILIDSEAGLLGTPIRENQYINFDVLFEPRVRLGGLFDIQSTINTMYNGQYRIVSIKHSGNISSTTQTSVKTTLQGLAGTKSFTEVKQK